MNILFKQVSDFYKSQGLKPDSRVGFRRAQSTSDAIGTFNVYDFEETGFTWVYFLWYSKAFDFVDQATLLTKLSHYGIVGGGYSLL